MRQNLGLKKCSAALQVKGKDSFRFLNGMLTQDIQKESAGRSFMLTNKGKIISAINFIALSEDELCLWTDEKDFELFFQSLNKFLIADDVNLKPLGKFESWLLVESEFQFEKIKTKHPLGLEHIFPAMKNENYYVAPQSLLSPSHAEVLCFKNFTASEMDANSFWEKHFTSATPQWNLDLFHDDFFLEFPLADAVSFDKGCYVGQETVARGTFRGKVNKGYAQFISDKNLEAGDILNEAGEKIGHIRSANGNKATGIAKLDTPSEVKATINGSTHSLQVKQLMNESTFRKGR